MTESVNVRGIVHGKVQGVWYRGFTREQARQQGLCGYARNQPHGTVAFALTGTRTAIDTALEAMHVGPPLSQVSKIELSWHPAEPMSGFHTS